MTQSIFRRQWSAREGLVTFSLSLAMFWHCSATGCASVDGPMCRRFAACGLPEAFHADILRYVDGRLHVSKDWEYEHTVQRPGQVYAHFQAHEPV